MKKKFIIFFVLFSIVLLGITAVLFYNSYPQRTKRAIIVLGESLKFTEEELDSVKNCVIKKFLDSNEVYLQKLWYDEDRSNNALNVGVEETNKIVLYCDHHTGNKNLTNLNTNYKGYVWILYRNDKNDEWYVVDRGVM